MPRSAGCGAVCSFAVQTPDGSFQQYLSGPPTGAPLESAAIQAKINYGVADSMTEALTFILRTPRGVRLISLGQAPKAKVDGTGHVVGAIDFYIPDCLYFVPFDDGRSALGWGVNGRVDVNVFKPHPLENPDWTLLTQAVGGLIIQAIQTTSLDAGELVRFRSGDPRNRCHRRRSGLCTDTGDPAADRGFRTGLAEQIDRPPVRWVDYRELHGP